MKIEEKLDGLFLIFSSQKVKLRSVGVNVLHNDRKLVDRSPPFNLLASELPSICYPPYHQTAPTLTSAYARHNSRLSFNLLAVSEALVEEGLDPAVEFARILKGRPLVDENGEAVMDPATGQQARRYDIDSDVRVRMLSEILNYTQPKLKAVEVKMSGSLELTSEQLDQRLGALLQKAMK